MNELDMIKRQIEEQYRAQSNLQNQASHDQKQIVAPQLFEQMKEAQAQIISQTNPARALKIVLEGFRGNIQEDKVQGKFVNIGEPIMNEYGISRLASKLIPFVNDNTRLGNIERYDVRNIALKITDDITMDIGLHWRDYGIKNSPEKDIIVDACMALIFITLTRSQEADDKKFLSKIIIESLGSTQTKKPEKTGYFSGFLDKLNQRR